MPGAGLKETPAKILAANMQYFQAKAEEMLRQDNQSEAIKFKLLANEAAVQLAPYVHSKMPTLVVQPDAASEQYVIRVPNALPDGHAWAHAVSVVKAITAAGAATERS